MVIERKGRDNKKISVRTKWSILNRDRESARNVPLFLLSLLTILIFYDIPYLVEYYFPPTFRIFTSQKLIFFSFYVFILYLFIQKKLPFVYNDPLVRIALVYLCFSFLSELVSEQFLITFPYSRQVLASILLYISISFHLNTFSSLNFLIKIISICGLIFSLLAYYISKSPVIMLARSFEQLALGYERLTFQGINSNTYAYILVINIFLCLYVIISQRGSIYRYICIFAILFFIYSLILTYSRGAVISLLVALGFMILINRSLKYKSFILIFFILLMFVLFLSPMKERMEQLRYEKLQISAWVIKSSLSSRYFSAILALNDFKEHPLLGKGQVSQLQLGSIVTGNHIFYLNILAGRGGLAFIAFLLLLIRTWYAWKKSLQKLKYFKNGNMNLGFTIGAIFIVVLVMGFFAPIGYCFWIMLSMIKGFSNAVNNLETIKS